MNLWIRSQDKDDLVRADYVYISSNEPHCIMAYSNKTQIYLGQYETYERLLDVLDEIQRKMTQSTGYIVYEMPKDGEIK